MTDIEHRRQLGPQRLREAPRAKLDASAWPGVPNVFAGLVGALPKELV
jgi:hypothetical protein